MINMPVVRAQRPSQSHRFNIMLIVKRLLRAWRFATEKEHTTSNQVLNRADIHRSLVLFIVQFCIFDCFDDSCHILVNVVRHKFNLSEIAQLLNTVIVAQPLPDLFLYVAYPLSFEFFFRFYSLLFYWLLWIWLRCLLPLELHGPHDPVVLSYQQLFLFLFWFFFSLHLHLCLHLIFLLCVITFNQISPFSHELHSTDKCEENTVSSFFECFQIFFDVLN